MDNKVLKTIDNAIAQLDQKNGGQEAMVKAILHSVSGGLLAGDIKPMFLVVMEHSRNQLQILEQEKTRVMG